MPSNDQVSDVATYAASVRAVLSDLPSDQAEFLLEDLEDHLREIAAEAEGPLTDRLGPPAQYAQELRVAYGAAQAKVGRQAPTLGDLRRAVASAGQSAWYRELRAFLPQLRPAWWVLRAYLLVLVITAAFSPGYNLRPIPNPFSKRGLLEIVVAAIAIVLSVRLGRRNRPLGQGVRLLATTANVAIALLALPVLVNMGTFPYATVMSYSGQSVEQPLTTSNSPLTNIYPYSKDGKPLTEVLLYDQDGHPLLMNPNGDVKTEYPTGADGQPITNAYPLRQRHYNGDPVAAPRVAFPPWPAASATATASASPSPNPTR
jgi:uncharacterized membrane protein